MNKASKYSKMMRKRKQQIDIGYNKKPKNEEEEDDKMKDDYDDEKDEYEYNTEDDEREEMEAEEGSSLGTEVTEEDEDYKPETDDDKSDVTVWRDSASRKCFTCAYEGKDFMMVKIKENIKKDFCFSCYWKIIKYVRKGDRIRFLLIKTKTKRYWFDSLYEFNVKAEELEDDSSVRFGVYLKDTEFKDLDQWLDIKGDYEDTNDGECFIWTKRKEAIINHYNNKKIVKSKGSGATAPVVIQHKEFSAKCHSIITNIVDSLRDSLSYLIELNDGDYRPG